MTLENLTWQMIIEFNVLPNKTSAPNGLIAKFLIVVVSGLQTICM